MRRIHDQYRDFAAESIAAINAAAEAPGIASAFGALQLLYHSVALYVGS